MKHHASAVSRSLRGSARSYPPNSSRNRGVVGICRTSCPLCTPIGHFFQRLSLQPEKNDGTGPESAFWNYPPGVRTEQVRSQRHVQRVRQGGRHYIFFRSAWPWPEKNVRSAQQSGELSVSFGRMAPGTPLSGPDLPTSCLLPKMPGRPWPGVSRPRLSWLLKGPV